MDRYGIVNKEGRVVNVVVWDGKAKWQPPIDHIAIQHDEIDIDDKWDRDKKELTKRHFRADPIVVDETKV